MNLAGVPIWLIVVVVVFALLVILAILVAAIKCGCFKRKKPMEEDGTNEEIVELNDPNSHS